MYRDKLIKALIYAIRQKKMSVFTASEIVVNTYGGDLPRCADEILKVQEEIYNP